MKTRDICCFCRQQLDDSDGREVVQNSATGHLAHKACLPSPGALPPPPPEAAR